MSDPEILQMVLSRAAFPIPDFPGDFRNPVADRAEIPAFPPFAYHAADRVRAGPAFFQILQHGGSDRGVFFHGRVFALFALKRLPAAFIIGES